MWDEDGQKTFSVAEVKKLLRFGRNTQRQQIMKWIAWVPLKVNIFVWRLELDRLPTKDALASRGIAVRDRICSLCDAGHEDLLHLFTGCGFSYGVWTRIGKWCHLDPVFLFDVKDVLSIHKKATGSKWARKVVQGIVMIACWAIWKTRNSKVFEGICPKVCDVVANIKSWSFLWLKNRSRFTDLLWKEWVVDPLYMCIC
ncbi:putative reverse transcriptase zinc-binding domain-containing protein [Helianthus debilis subsp. tardiflorus]